VIIQITDREHPAYGSVMYRVRSAGPEYVEYRDGGRWHKVHVSQFREMVDRADGAIVAKAPDNR
jgi:hypothetical protein